MPTKRLAQFVMLPELKLLDQTIVKGTTRLTTEKTSAMEVCPKCATPSKAIYDRRKVAVRDAPIRGTPSELAIIKRRFWCQPCGKPFTESVSGISKGRRTTERYRRHLLWACENFSDLKAVRKHMRCSTSAIYRIYYEQLELKQRARKAPWPKMVGIDEHRFRRGQHGMEFATVVADHSHKKVFELVDGRSKGELEAALMAIPGRENVKFATIDLSTTYRSFIKGFFPNARIVADKFHVIRLLHPAINRRRKEITGDVRKLPIRRLLLKDSRKLDFFTRSAIYRWLEDHPDLKEIYHAKEALHGFYRIKGYNRATRALNAMLDRLGQSQVPEVITFRKTLLSWRKEILEYFRTRLTNGRVEGYNNKAKLIRKRGYGYRSFANYRLRVLNACA